MQENFLHYLWRNRRFDCANLKTTKDETLTILDFGEYNTNAGPDFLNATIRVRDMVWAGNIEMHIKSSDWLLHGRQAGRAFRRAKTRGQGVCRVLPVD